MPHNDNLLGRWVYYNIEPCYVAMRDLACVGKDDEYYIVGRSGDGWVAAAEIMDRRFITDPAVLAKLELMYGDTVRQEISDLVRVIASISGPHNPQRMKLGSRMVYAD